MMERLKHFHDEIAREACQKYVSFSVHSFKQALHFCNIRGVTSNNPGIIMLSRGRWGRGKMCTALDEQKGNAQSWREI